MKQKIITTFPVVFSLLPNSDYSRFVIASQPETAVKQAWAGVGSRLSAAMQKVGKDVEKPEPRA